jgi:carbon dioxide concentrating mechanism protein CcmN
MDFLSLQLRSIETAHYFVSGDVTIQTGSAIASGVLIQADPDSRVVIGAGVCIGLGSVIHAHGGTIEIGEGASIGAGVLLVGAMKIGARACVGSASTILDSSIGAGGLVPPGSLLGDRSRSQPELQVTDTPPMSEPPAATGDPWTDEPSAEEKLPKEKPSLEKPPDVEKAAEVSEKVAEASVYGQTYVNNLLVRLFPNQRNLNSPPENGHLNGG